MSQTIVEAKGLCLNIGRKVVLDDIDTAFLTGESVLIAGRNGAGKSTFLRCLTGVILPDRGEVSYAEGMDRDKIGFISDRVSLLENLTLKQGMDFHASAFHIADFDDSLITKLDLNLKQKIKHLSAGERVLFHLALIVAQRPEILLVDEIIHTIDTYMRTQILDALIDLMDKHQTTVIMVNHTFSEVEKIPERILIMEKGRFILDEKTEDLRAKIKKVTAREPISAELPCIFASESEFRKEYYLYPFEEEFRKTYSYEYQDLDLTEIMKAFIGGQYVKERNS